MKSYAQIVKRRVEAALRVRVRRNADVAPVVAGPVAPVPVEIIDLATGPFVERFPDLPLRSRKTRP